MEGAEDLVVIELEALGRFEPLHVFRVRRWLGHLFRTPLGLVLPLRILRGDPRTPAAAAMMAVVLMGGGIWEIMRRAVVVAGHVCALPVQRETGDGMGCAGWRQEMRRNRDHNKPGDQTALRAEGSSLTSVLNRESARRGRRH